MRVSILTKLTLAAVLLSAGIAPAQANEAQRPSRAAMKAAIEEMGVAPNDMRGCMKDARPSNAQSGDRPTEAQRLAIAEKLFSCLNDKNPELTRAEFETAMTKLRPGS